VTNTTTDSDVGASAISLSIYEDLPGLVVAVMWALIVIGVGCCVAAILLHFQLGETSETTQTVTQTGVNTITTKTQVMSSFSDALCIAVFGVGAALALAGAFFPRITSITIAGTVINIGAIRKRARKAVLQAKDKVKPNATDAEVKAAVDEVVNEVLIRTVPSNYGRIRDTNAVTSRAGTGKSEMFASLAEYALTRNVPPAAAGAADSTPPTTPST